jgi:organic radical activating enzyme
MFNIFLFTLMRLRECMVKRHWTAVYFYSITILGEMRMRVKEKIRKITGAKPHLRYLELHLADHCNLNCKGCTHFSPIAEKRLADLNEHQRDMKQLQKLFASIDRIVLMGGEPLLNPQIDSFLFATRACFPEADILVYTNGILLPQMPETFWKACRACSVGIDITIYPPLKQKESALIKLVKDSGLKVFVHSVTSFRALYNKKGDTNSTMAFKKCRKRQYTPMLREGRIYVCPISATIDCFNEKYGLKVPKNGFVDIYEPSLNGWDTKEQLNKPSSTCCYCTLGWDDIPVFPWTTSKLVFPDWDALANQSPIET